MVQYSCFSFNEYDSGIWEPGENVGKPNYDSGIWEPDLEMLAAQEGTFQYLYYFIIKQYINICMSRILYITMMGKLIVCFM